MRCSPHALIALPVFNEVKFVNSVLDEVRKHTGDILVVDDGSVDGTAELLAARGDVQLITHSVNHGYGAALKSAFDYAISHAYEVLVTIDCDGQHEPIRIPTFVQACQRADIVSGSRYLEPFSGDSLPPFERQQINQLVTAELNRRLDLRLTDAFCGFKAYRVEALRQLDLQETGYAMPLELWVQAANRGLRIKELAVPLIYLDEDRSFGGALDDGQSRLAYYRQVINYSLARLPRPQIPPCGPIPSGESAGCH